MDAISIVGGVVSKSIAIARIPLDLANTLLGRRGLAVDAVDARVRESAGTLLGDRELRADGARQRAATNQRERAQRLRTDAERRTQAATKSSAKSREKVSELEDAERLAQLKNEAEVLDERQSAHVAADKAKRLKATAERVKRERKSRSTSK